MGVSRNRKEHKKKSRQRTEEIKNARKKEKQRLIQAYIEQQRKLAEARDTQKTGEVVEDAGIDVDVLEDIDVLEDTDNTSEYVEEKSE